MSTQREKAERFLALHHGETPLLMPNAWDQGTAKLFASMGFEAIATTSSGHAATLGRLDGRVTRGADVYRDVMRRIWWAYPLFLFSVAPGLRSLFDGGYRAFARNRHRFSRACGLPPGASPDPSGR